MKVLVSAFSCCPGLGSEPGVGWHTIEELAREHDVWALVDRSCEAKLSAALEGKRPERIHVYYVGIPLLTQLVNGPLNNGLAWLVYYYVWQIVQWRVARTLHSQVGFDACHHATFVKYNVPSFLHLLGIPFIWGPVGGAETAPAAFYREFGWKTRLAEAGRSLLQRAATIDPWLRWCHRRSSRALAVTEQTAGAMRSLGARQVGLLPAVALSHDETASLTSTGPTQARPLTLLFVGRLIPWKGIHLGMRAMAAATDQDLRLRIIGDGPLRSFLEVEAQRLGIASRVEFTGSLPRDAVLSAYGKADGFLYPSLHDSGGNAVLEAMGAGLPVLCLRYGGPDLLVNNACGWKIAAVSPADAVAGLTIALNEFAAEPVQRQLRGAAARAHCLAQHTWEARGKALRQIHEDVQNEPPRR